MSNGDYQDDHYAGSALVEIEYQHVRRKAEDAVLFTIDEREVWLPRREIHNWNEELKTLDVPEWLAIDRELV